MLIFREADECESEVYFSLVLFSLHLRAGMDVEATEVALVHYSEVTATLG